MTDQELDQLFARARADTPADAGAAERFLAGHRARQAHARHLRAGWLSALLASAAVVTGVLVVRPASGFTELPASAAYDAYQSAWGQGW